VPLGCERLAKAPSRLRSRGIHSRFRTPSVGRRTLAEVALTTLPAPHPPRPIARGCSMQTRTTCAPRTPTHSAASRARSRSTAHRRSASGCRSAAPAVPPTVRASAPRIRGRALRHESGTAWMSPIGSRCPGRGAAAAPVWRPPGVELAHRERGARTQECLGRYGPAGAGLPERMLAVHVDNGHAIAARRGSAGVCR
jgi:hypothetical protein